MPLHTAFSKGPYSLQKFSARESVRAFSCVHATVSLAGGMASIGEDEQLIVIVDATDQGWSAAARGASSGVGETGDAPGKKLTFSEFVTVLHLFLAAYCSTGRKKSLAVLAFDGYSGGYAWPRADAEHHDDTLRGARVTRAVDASLLHLKFGAAAATADAPVGKDGQAATAVAADAVSRQGVFAPHAHLSSCLSLALCFHNSVSRKKPGVTSRVLVLAAQPDVPTEYIAVINATFSAQRFGVPIDSVMLGTHSSVALQQAAHLTDGVHTEPSPEQHSGLFQFLVTLYLPGKQLRSSLVLPSKHSVDLRASCFCHKKHVETAWVCSVCLSIWCQYAGTCPTCGSTAPLDKFVT